jgi:NAD(P)-dependent dehydrogenase (short-subunit alcohol dehydrogenase family)
MQFGSNHLGHFLLGCLLAPALRKGAPSRVVSVSSRGHHLSPVVFDDIQFEAPAVRQVAVLRPGEDGERAVRRRPGTALGRDGVHANALHPGAIMTELARHLVLEDFELMRARNPGMVLKTVEAGAATACLHATGTPSSKDAAACISRTATSPTSTTRPKGSMV